jgi:hypothetical protein
MFKTGFTWYEVLVMTDRFDTPIRLATTSKDEAWGWWYEWCPIDILDLDNTRVREVEVWANTCYQDNKYTPKLLNRYERQSR